MKIFYRKPHGLYNCQGVIKVLKQTAHLSTRDFVFLFSFQTFHNDISRGLSIIRVYIFMHPFIMKNEFPESNGGKQGDQVCKEELMLASRGMYVLRVHNNTFYNFY